MALRATSTARAPRRSPARIGERVAAAGVTVIDDGSLAGRRGSLTIDDEGTPTERTVLIEDGVLKGYMHDRMSARLMGLGVTGNARRQSYAHLPMPRMTNTAMLGGDTPREEMIRSTKRGLYCANFGGGQVDITNGKFVFQCTEAYLIEDGKVTAPVKGATLIGDGPLGLDPGFHDRRRLRLRSRHRRLRQGGPERAGGRRPAVLEDWRTDRGRHKPVTAGCASL